jgi:hypothetical protein
MVATNLAKTAETIITHNWEELKSSILPKVKSVITFDKTMYKGHIDRTLPCFPVRADGSLDFEKWNKGPYYEKFNPDWQGDPVLKATYAQKLPTLGTPEGNLLYRKGDKNPLKALGIDDYSLSVMQLSQVRVTFDLVREYKDWDGKLREYARAISRFHLMQLPGCCGVCLSYHADSSANRGIGIGKIMLALREQIAYADGFALLLNTYTADNDAQVAVLKRFGYNVGAEFRNLRTDRMVRVGYKVLTAATAGKEVEKGERSGKEAKEAVA